MSAARQLPDGEDDLGLGDDATDAPSGPELDAERIEADADAELLRRHYARGPR